MINQDMDNFEIIKFNPNEGNGGFNKGEYDNLAVQPTTVNWTYQSRFVGPNKPTVVWEVVFKNICGKSQFVIGSDGVIYFGSVDGCLYAVYPNGSYRCILKSDYALGTPALGKDGVIYIGSTSGSNAKVHKLYAISTSYTLKWELELNFPIIFPPFIDESGMIYVVTRETKLYAITKDGVLKWSFSKKFEYWSVPVISNNGLIYIELYCVDNSGVEQWSKLIGHGGDGFNPKLGDDGTFYVCVYCNNQRIIRAINPDSSQKWDFAVEQGDAWTTPSLSKGGILYIGASQFRIISLTTEGILRWKTKIDGFIITSPLIGADGVIYAATYNSMGSTQISKIFAINPDGIEKWVYEFKHGKINSIALGGNGTIYVLISDSKKNQIILYSLADKI